MLCIFYCDRTKRLMEGRSLILYFTTSRDSNRFRSGISRYSNSDWSSLRWNSNRYWSSICRNSNCWWSHFGRWSYWRGSCVRRRRYWRLLPAWTVLRGSFLERSVQILREIRLRKISDLGKLTTCTFLLQGTAGGVCSIRKRR